MEELSPELKLKKNKRGWQLFIIALSLSFFIGGGLRAYLFSDSLEKEVNKLIHPLRSEFQIDIQGLNLELSNGLWPGLKIKIAQIDLLKSQDCSNVDEIRLSNLDFSVGFFKSIFYQKIIIQKIFASEARINLISQVCGERKSLKNDDLKNLKKASLLDETDKVNKNAIELSKKLYKLRLQLKRKLETSNSSFVENLDSIEIEKIILVNKTPEIYLDDFEMKIYKNASKNFNFKFSSNINYPKYKILLKKPVSLDLDLSEDHLSYLLRIPFKEGYIVTKSILNLDKKNIKIKSIFYNFPIWKISNLMDELGEKAFVHFKSKDLWTNCEISFNFIEENMNSTLSVTGCEIYGSEGKVFIDAQISEILDQIHLNNIKISIEKFSLKTFLSYFGGEGPSGVFTDFGHLDSEISITNSMDVNWNWKISDMKMRFLNRGRKANEKISEMMGSMNLKNKRFSGVLKEVKLEDGEFKGELSFNLDEKFKEGFLQFNITKIVLSSKVQKLLFGGEASSASVFGKAKIKNSLIDKWKGSLGFKDAKGEGWETENLKLNMIYENKIIETNVSATNLSFKKDHKIAEWLNPLNFNFSKNLKDVSIKSLTGDLRVENQRGSWSKFKVKTPESFFSSSGHWGKEGDVEAIFLAGKDNLKWILKGPIENLYLKMEKSSRMNLKSSLSSEEMIRLKKGYSDVFPFYAFSEEDLSIDKLKKISNKVIDETVKTASESN